MWYTGRMYRPHPSPRALQSVPSTRTIKRVVANIFGTLGYGSLLIQWLWVALLYGPLLLDQPVAKLLLPSDVPSKPAEPIAVVAPSPSIFIVAGVITIVVVALTVYVLAKLPKVIGETGQRITQDTATALVTVATRHRPLKPVKKRRLTSRVVAGVKVALSVVPLLAVLPAVLLPALPLSYDIILVVAAASAIMTVGCFGLQYALAWVLKLKLQYIW